MLGQSLLYRIHVPGVSLNDPQIIIPAISYQSKKAEMERLVNKQDIIHLSYLCLIYLNTSLLKIYITFIEY